MGNGLMGFDPTIDLGVEPLQSLEALRQPTVATSPSVRRPAATTPTSSDEGDSGAREFLAQALMGLGEGFGYKAPSFLTDTLKERRKERTDIAKETRKQAIQSDAGTALAQGIKAEMEGNTAEALKYYQAAIAHPGASPEMRKEAYVLSRDAIKGANQQDAGTKLQSFVTRQGVADFTRQQYAQLYQLALKSFGDPATAREFVSRIDIWTGPDKTEAFMETRMGGPNGRLMSSGVPIERLQKAGEERLVRLFGNTLVDTYLLPSREKLSTGQEVQQLPGEVVPGPGAQGQPSPVGGIQPVGGVVPTQETPPARTVATGPPVDTPLTAEQQALLSNTPFKDVRTFNQLSKSGGGPQLVQALKDAEVRKGDAILSRAMAPMDAREQAKAKALIGRQALRYIHRDTLQHPASSLATGAVENDPSYVQLTPERIRAVQSLPAIAGNFDELDDIVNRRDDLFPRSTGNVDRDKANVLVVQAKAWARGMADPDIARLKALEIQVPQAIKLYGDTGNISVSERLTAVGSLGLGPNLAESTWAQIDLHRRGLNRSLGPLNVAPHFKIPDRTPSKGSPSPQGGQHVLPSGGKKRWW